MAKEITGLTSAKRFGARYGRRVKELFENAEKLQRAWHKCPSCHAMKVSRLAVGIWGCKKCRITFTGRAYVPYEKFNIPTTYENEDVKLGKPSEIENAGEE